MPTNAFAVFIMLQKNLLATNHCEFEVWISVWFSMTAESCPLCVTKIVQKWLRLEFVWWFSNSKTLRHIWNKSPKNSYMSLSLRSLRYPLFWPLRAFCSLIKISFKEEKEITSLTIKVAIQHLLKGSWLGGHDTYYYVIPYLTRAENGFNSHSISFVLQWKTNYCKNIRLYHKFCM